MGIDSPTIPRQPRRAHANIDAPRRSVPAALALRWAGDPCASLVDSRERAVDLLPHRSRGRRSVRRAGFPVLLLLVFRLVLCGIWDLVELGKPCGAGLPRSASRSRGDPLRMGLFALPFSPADAPALRGFRSEIESTRRNVVEFVDELRMAVRQGCRSFRQVRLSLATVVAIRPDDRSSPRYIVDSRPTDAMLVADRGQPASHPGRADPLRMPSKE